MTACTRVRTEDTNERRGEQNRVEAIIRASLLSQEREGTDVRANTHTHTPTISLTSELLTTDVNWRNMITATAAASHCSSSPIPPPSSSTSTTAAARPDDDSCSPPVPPAAADAVVLRRRLHRRHSSPEMLPSTTASSCDAGTGIPDLHHETLIQIGASLRRISQQFANRRSSSCI